MVSLGTERRPGGKLPAIAAVVLACLAVGLPSVAFAASGGAGPSGTKKPRPPAKSGHPASARALTGRGMWIWYVSHSNGGDLASIASAAHSYGVTTLMIKAGDGPTPWSQFNSSLVSYFHSQGISVCAWQYVYGAHPIFEAEVGAEAVQAGADCLLIDAEAEYEGKYVQAQEYINKLRQLVGTGVAVGLASFPYVDYHPGLPYSVFLGPKGAQYNVPQMYWPDIQTTVDSVYSHTYRYNLPYQRPIEPLGEVAGNPAPNQVMRFRQLSRSYGADNVSWWDWQESSQRDWIALSRPVGSLASFSASPGMPMLSVKSQGGISGGDLVVWAQEHLYSAGQQIGIDGGFGNQTQNAVQNFQSAHGLSVTGVVDASTWQALLRYRPVNVIWSRHHGKPTATTARKHITGLTLAPPASAHDRATRYEIPAHLGRG